MMKSIDYHNQEQTPHRYHRETGKDEIGTPLFLLLPLELRHEIYKYSIIESRRPPAEMVHKNLLSAIWEDFPSPLFGVNKQIRAEVSDFLQRSPFTMRITWQDKKFDCLALSSFIAQQRKGYDDIPHLVVEVWPPVSDRPSDMYSIWKHLQQLRNELRAVSRVSRFDLVFLENSIATWSDKNGKPRHWLDCRQEPEEGWSPWDNDMECIFDLFIRLANIAEAHIYLPDSLVGAGQDIEVRISAQEAEEVMMGIYVVGRIYMDERDADLLERSYDGVEVILEHDTAKYARDKLDAMTNYGLNKISEAEYYDFITIWPYLDTLRIYSRGNGYKGMWHYTKARDTENLPSHLLDELPFYEC